MGNRIKIENCLVGSAVYLNCEGLSKDGRTIKVPARTEGKGLPFVFISEDELSWLLANSKIFDKGYVRIAEGSEIPEGIKEEIPTEKSVTVLDIDAILKLSATKFKAEVSKIDRPDIIKEMLKKAEEMDVGVKTISVLKGRLGEILPSFDFSTEPVAE